jgi:hypothetical protein
VKNVFQAIAALFGDPPAAAIQARKRSASQTSNRRKL